MMASSLRIPTFAQALGFGGLVPFVLFSAGLWLPLSEMQHAAVRVMLFSYGALILSFLGAVHWGLALTRANEGGEPDALALLWGVIPCLIGWIALMLPPLPCGGLLVAGFVCQWLMDRRRLAALGAPPWYFTLRSRLSVLVILCLTVAVASPA